MLTFIVFGLLLLQSSLNEVFNPRLRRGRAARKKAAKGDRAADEPIDTGRPEVVGAAGLLETPTTAGTEQR
jgi:peptide/nickel transport system permease protein